VSQKQPDSAFHQVGEGKNSAKKQRGGETHSVKDDHSEGFLA